MRALGRWREGAFSLEFRQWVEKRAGNPGPLPTGALLTTGGTLAVANRGLRAACCRCWRCQLAGGIGGDLLTHAAPMPTAAGALARCRVSIWAWRLQTAATSVAGVTGGPAPPVGATQFRDRPGRPLQCRQRHPPGKYHPHGRRPPRPPSISASSSFPAHSSTPSPNSAPRPPNPLPAQRGTSKKMLIRTGCCLGLSSWAPWSRRIACSEAYMVWHGTRA